MRDQGYDVILATNPIFPLEGVRTRLSWVGLTPEDFSLVTTYESSSYTKPNPAYFTQTSQQAGKRPGECLMVGNDLAEDTGAVAAGLSLYVVTDCLENGTRGTCPNTPTAASRSSSLSPCPPERKIFFQTVAFATGKDSLPRVE